MRRPRREGAHDRLHRHPCMPRLLELALHCLQVAAAPAAPKTVIVPRLLPLEPLRRRRPTRRCSNGSVLSKNARNWRGHSCSSGSV